VTGEHVNSVIARHLSSSLTNVSRAVSFHDRRSLRNHSSPFSQETHTSGSKSKPIVYIAHSILRQQLDLRRRQSRPPGARDTALTPQAPPAASSGGTRHWFTTSPAIPPPLTRRRPRPQAARDTGSPPPAASRSQWPPPRAPYPPAACSPPAPRRACLER